MSKRQPRGDTGAKSTSIYLTDEEREFWERMANMRGWSKKEAFLEGLRALERADNGSGISNAELLEELKRRLS